MHKQIKSQLAPYSSFPRITRIEDIGPLTASDINDFKADFPELIEALETPQKPVWLDSNCSTEEKVSQSIADTMACISKDLRYSDDF